MATSSRERITLDLQGLRSAVMARAQQMGATPSDWIRRVLSEHLQVVREPASDLPRSQQPFRGTATRLCLRMPARHIQRIHAASAQAGLSAGAYVAGLVDGIPVLAQGSFRPDLLRALTESNAEVASLSRNLHHLSRLLQQGDEVSASVYRPMLETLGVDVRRHLSAAARGLAALQPRSHSGMPGSM